MATSTWIIKDANDIRALAGELDLLHADRRKLEVSLPQFDAEGNAQIHRRIARHYTSCGCHEGRVAGIGILGVYVLLFASGALSFAALGIFKVVGLYFLLSFCGLLVSKIVLLERARRALRRLAREVEAPRPTMNTLTQEG